jgi:hypothetical protein
MLEKSYQEVFSLRAARQRPACFADDAEDRRPVCRPIVQSPWNNTLHPNKTLELLTNASGGHDVKTQIRIHCFRVVFAGDLPAPVLFFPAGEERKDGALSLPKSLPAS